MPHTRRDNFEMLHGCQSFGTSHVALTPLSDFSLLSRHSIPPLRVEPKAAPPIHFRHGARWHASHPSGVAYAMARLRTTDEYRGASGDGYHDSDSPVRR